LAIGIQAFEFRSISAYSRDQIVRTTQFLLEIMMQMEMIPMLLPRRAAAIRPFFVATLSFSVLSPLSVYVAKKTSHQTISEDTLKKYPSVDQSIDVRAITDTTSELGHQKIGHPKKIFERFASAHH